MQNILKFRHTKYKDIPLVSRYLKGSFSKCRFRIHYEKYSGYDIRNDHPLIDDVLLPLVHDIFEPPFFIIAGSDDLRDLAKVKTVKLQKHNYDLNTFQRKRIKKAKMLEGGYNDITELVEKQYCEPWFEKVEELFYLETSDETIVHNLIRAHISQWFSNFIITTWESKDMFVPYDLWADIIIFDDEKRERIKEKYAFCVSPGL